MLYIKTKSTRRKCQGTYDMMTEEPTKMSNKFSEKFVTMRGKPVTDETSRKPVTGETSRKPVTGDNVTEDKIGKPVTTTHDPAGPDQTWG